MADKYINVLFDNANTGYAEACGILSIIGFETNKNLGCLDQKSHHIKPLHDYKKSVAAIVSFVRCVPSRLLRSKGSSVHSVRPSEWLYSCKPDPEHQ